MWEPKIRFTGKKESFCDNFLLLQLCKNIEPTLWDSGPSKSIGGIKLNRAIEMEFKCFCQSFLCIDLSPVLNKDISGEFYTQSSKLTQRWERKWVHAFCPIPFQTLNCHIELRYGTQIWLINAINCSHTITSALPTG